MGRDHPTALTVDRSCPFLTGHRELIKKESNFEWNDNRSVSM